MKKLLLLLFLVVSISANAQWKIGAGGGVSLNMYHNQHQLWKNDNYIFGLSAGVSGQYDFNSHFGIRIEIDWTTKNNRKFFGDYSDDVGYKTTNHYFQMPIMLTGHLNWGKWQPFANIGLYGAYWASSSVHSDLAIRDYGGINSDYDNRFDFGLVGGCGIEYFLTEKLSVQIEARCYYSTLTWKKEINGIMNPQYNTTFVFQPSICYSF